MVFQKLKPLIIALSAVFLILSGFSCSEQPRQMIRGQAADFKLPAVHNPQDSVALSQFQGQVRLVAFWATWCTPCIIEIPTLNQLQAEFAEQGFTVLAVNIDQGDRERVPDFVRQKNMQYPVLLGDSKTVQKYGAFNSIPMSFLIDRAGNFIEIMPGLVPAATLRNKISAALRPVE